MPHWTLFSLTYSDWNNNEYFCCHRPERGSDNNCTEKFNWPKPWRTNVETCGVPHSCCCHYKDKECCNQPSLDKCKNNEYAEELRNLQCGYDMQVILRSYQKKIYYIEIVF